MGVGGGLVGKTTCSRGWDMEWEVADGWEHARWKKAQQNNAPCSITSEMPGKCNVPRINSNYTTKPFCHPPMLTAELLTWKAKRAKAAFYFACCWTLDWSWTLISGSHLCLSECQNRCAHRTELSQKQQSANETAEHWHKMPRSRKCSVRRGPHAPTHNLLKKGQGKAPEGTKAAKGAAMSSHLP